MFGGSGDGSGWLMGEESVSEVSRKNLKQQESALTGRSLNQAQPKFSEAWRDQKNSLFWFWLHSRDHLSDFSNRTQIILK